MVVKRKTQNRFCGLLKRLSEGSRGFVANLITKSEKASFPA